MRARVMHAPVLVLVGLLSIAMVSSVDARLPVPPDDPNCLQIYDRHDLGPVSILRSGCSTRIEYHGTDCEDWKPAAC